MESPQRPQQVRYTKEHEWVALDQEGYAVIGISDYAAGELGDVVYVQLPEVGSTIQQLQKFGEIESVKAVSDLYAPVSGEVVAVNEQVTAAPEVVNQSPADKGWLLRVRMSNPDELNTLMDTAQYEAYLKELERQALGGE
ncbi:MAG: glycine cleavage system protein GcvH [Chloroflexi bacterium]|nr:glycine cleavage system protein GcvH [Chloroflexota bacterium]